jgi:hypothetical protein
LSAGIGQETKRALGLAANLRGHANESRAVRLLSEAWPSRPAWIEAVRLGSPAEDGRGIDLVVESDVGALHLQIKSSALQAQLFRPRRGELIAAVCGRGNDRAVRDRLVDALESLRSQVLAKRGAA